MDDVLATFTVRQSGNIGQVILGPDGQIVAWTTDVWIAQVICGLLIANEELLVIKKEKQHDAEYPTRGSF